MLFRSENSQAENPHGAWENKQKQLITAHYSNTPKHPRYPSAELKYAAIQRCFEQGEDVEYVSREISYSRMSIYAWRRKYLKYGMVGLMSKKNRIPRQPLLPTDPPAKSDELEVLQAQIRKLQLEVIP